MKDTPWVVLFMDETSLDQLLLPSDLQFYEEVREHIKPPMRSDLIRLMILHRSHEEHYSCMVRLLRMLARVSRTIQYLSL